MNSEHTPEQWAANAAAPGEKLGVQCLAQGSHLSRGLEGINMLSDILSPVSFGSELLFNRLSKLSVIIHMHSGHMGQRCVQFHPT